MEQNPTTGPGTRLPRLFSRPLALVVEPDPAAAEIAMGMLDLLGYDLERVTTGAAALEAIAEQQPALLLLNVGLSDLAAEEVLRILATSPSAADLVVVATSSTYAVSSPEVTAVRGLGVQHFLSTPFTVRLFRDPLARAHPDGPVDGYEVLGTTSSSFELPDYDSLAETASTESFERAPAVEPLTTGSFTAVAEEPAPPPATWSTTLMVGGSSVEAELERVLGDELHLRTWGERLPKGAVVEVRVDVQGESNQTLRYHGEVVRAGWRFGGGRSRVAVRATVPPDAINIAAGLLRS